MFKSLLSLFLVFNLSIAQAGAPKFSLKKELVGISQKLKTMTDGEYESMLLKMSDDIAEKDPKGAALLELYSDPAYRPIVLTQLNDKLAKESENGLLLLAAPFAIPYCIFAYPKYDPYLGWKGCLLFWLYLSLLTLDGEPAENL